MSRTRSLSFPRFSRSKFSDEPTMAALDSSCQFTPSHSRESSTGSTTSSPITSTFSARSHSRWPSSTSSLVTNPDSPANTTPAAKSTLGDLVEHPSEREESSFESSESSRDFPDEPLCICDSPFCGHRQFGAQTELPSPLEWTPGDDYFSDSELPGEHMSKRRRSGQFSTDSFASRLSRHFPSFSRRYQGHRTSASISGTNLRSAPPSRTSSLRLSGIRSITAPAASDFRNTIVTPPFSPTPTETNERSVSPPRARASSRATSRPVDIGIPPPQESSEDREQLASTPLLPPMLVEHCNNSNEAFQSPLQSPTIAAPSTAASVNHSPASTPVLPVFQTPSLSARESLASLRNARAGLATHQSEIPPLAIAEESDQWAIKLGHANFHIIPEPYIPDVCDAQTCRRLADDWESARVEYMRLAARTSEHYGPTSNTYKLTHQKWAEIDDEWRANHEKANAEAQASGESPFFQPLAETEQLAKMPSLNDPEQPSKFPEIEEKDIVGPMVRYAKIHHESKQSKRPSFLKLFTDPASLLGRRSSPSIRR